MTHIKDIVFMTSYVVSLLSTKFSEIKDRRLGRLDRTDYKDCKYCQCVLESSSQLSHKLEMQPASPESSRSLP